MPVKKIIKGMERYIIQLLKEVFPKATGNVRYYPSLKAKKSLDQVINYINTTDARDKKSQMLIQIFIDALFNKIGFVRTTAAVFLSDVRNRQIMGPRLLRRLHSYLSNKNPTSELSVNKLISLSTIQNHSEQNKASAL